MSLETEVYRIIQAKLSDIQNTVLDVFQTLNREINLDLDYCEVSHDVHEKISKRIYQGQELILKHFRE